MKLVVFTVCLYFTAAAEKHDVHAESREYARRVLHDDEGDVSLESEESVDFLPANSVLTPTRRALENEKPESNENKSNHDVVLRTNYVLMPNGDKVDIPESIQSYRQCFGNEILQRIMEWIVEKCKQGLCENFRTNEVSKGNPPDLVGPSERDSKGQNENQAENASPKKDRKNKPGQKKKEEESKRSTKKEKPEEVRSNENDVETRKEIRGKKPGKKRTKVIPYKRERTELEEVTFQFKALPSKDKDRFCKYLENDLLSNPLLALKSLLGRVQFGDKKESGVHYDRNRGAILAAMENRADRETQILKWACEDRRDGQRKLYFPVKRYLPVYKTSQRRRDRGKYLPTAFPASALRFFKPISYGGRMYNSVRHNDEDDEDDDTIDLVDSSVDDLTDDGDSMDSAEYEDRLME